MRYSIFFVIIAFVLSAIALNRFVSDPEFQSTREKIHHFDQIDDHREVRKGYNRLIKTDSSNIDHYFNFLKAHFRIPAEETSDGEVINERDDKKIRKKIKTLRSHSKQEIRDIGKICAGYYNLQKEKYPGALKMLDRVSEKGEKYLNYLLGRIYLRIGESTKAIRSFEKEIENEGYEQGAVYQLSIHLEEAGESQKLEELIGDDEHERYIPFSVKKAHYMSGLDLFSYYYTLFNIFYYNFGWLVFLSSVLVSLMWGIYIVMIDVYEKEDWGQVLSVFLLGMLFSFLVFPASDFLNVFLSFGSGEGYLQPLLYQIVAVGMIEEFVKILPLLLLLRFTKVVNEPFDYILYASISALGFAMVENILYFSNGGVKIMFMRALFSVVGHMFYSSIIAYGLVLNEYKRRWNPLLNFVLFFLIASSLHGSSNFLLGLEGLRVLKIVPWILFVLSLGIWTTFKENALSHSEFFDKNKKFEMERYSDYVLYGLSGVLLFQYWVLSLKYGPTYGNEVLMQNLDGGAYLLLLVSYNLGRIKPRKGKWSKVSLISTKFSYSTDIEYDKVVGETVDLLPFSKHRLAKKYLPNRAKVSKRVTISNEEDWYLLYLDDEADTEEYFKDRVFIRTKEKVETLEENKRNIIALYLIPSEEDIEKESLSREDLICVHWAILQWGDDNQ